MTDAEAIEFVNGMIKNVRPRYRDDEANSWARKIEWYTLPDGLPDGVVRDYKEADWTVNKDLIPNLVAASPSDGAAYDTATNLIWAYLRWQRALPESLAKYAISRLTGAERKPRRKLNSMQARDEMAAISINWLVKNSTILADKSETTPEKVTGISVVTQALRVAGYNATEAAVRAAYYRNRGTMAV